MFLRRMGIAKLNLNQFIVGSLATIIVFHVLFQLRVLEIQYIYSVHSVHVVYRILRKPV